MSRWLPEVLMLLPRWSLPLLLAVGVWFLGGTPSSILGAEESASEAVVVESAMKDGLRFKVLPDWPIEKRGGITAPIPIEEYLAQKFSALEKRLRALEKRLMSLGGRLRVLEEEPQRQEQLRSIETPP